MFGRAFFVFVFYLPTIVLSVGAIILSLNGVGTWGWFLLVALLLASRSVEVKNQ